MLGRSLVLAALLALAGHALLAQSTDLRFTGVSGSIIQPGGYPTIDVGFINYGPSAAADLKLTITIPDGATYATYDAPSEMKCAGPPTGNAGTFTCTNASFAVSPFVGGKYYATRVDLIPRVDPATPPGTVLTFQVTLTSSNAQQPSQSATATVTVAAPANLAISANAPAEVTAGDALVSTVTVTNRGPGDGIGVNVYLASSAATPQQMTAPAGWDCNGGGCYLHTFPPGAASFVMTSVVPATLTVPQVTQKFETASSNDPDVRDNTVSVTTAVDPAAQTTLKIALAAPAHFYAGDIVTFTATATNTGSSTAYNVNMGMSFNGSVTATTCGFLYGSAVSCTFPSLAAGATQTITSTVHVNGSPGGQLTNSAFAYAFNAAPDNTSLTTTLYPAPPPYRRRAARH